MTTRSADVPTGWSPLRTRISIRGGKEISYVSIHPSLGLVIFKSTTTPDSQDSSRLSRFSAPRLSRAESFASFHTSTSRALSVASRQTKHSFDSNQSNVSESECTQPPLNAQGCHRIVHGSQCDEVGSLNRTRHDSRSWDIKRRSTTLAKLVLGNLSSRRHLDEDSKTSSRVSSPAPRETWNESHATLIGSHESMTSGSIDTPAPALRASGTMADVRRRWHEHKRSRDSESGSLLHLGGRLAAPALDHKYSDSSIASIYSASSDPQVNGHRAPSLCEFDLPPRSLRRSRLPGRRFARLRSVIKLPTRSTFAGRARHFRDNALNVFKNSTNRVSRHRQIHRPGSRGYNRVSMEGSSERYRNIEKSVCPVLPSPNLGETFIGEGTRSADDWGKAMNGMLTGADEEATPRLIDHAAGSNLPEDRSCM